MNIKKKKDFYRDKNHPFVLKIWCTYVLLYGCKLIAVLCEFCGYTAQRSAETEWMK